MPSRCNFPSFDLTFSLPISIPGLPSLPDLAFTLAFSLPCPLD
jgi:hypothetical protein